MAIKYNNNAKTVLANTINFGTDLSMEVVDGTVLPTLVVGTDVMYLTLSDLGNSVTEIVKCTAVVGNTCTIVRGQEGTAPISWVAGSNVQLRLTAGLLETLLDGKVDDSQVLKNVPANAVFTDTQLTIGTAASHAAAGNHIHTAASTTTLGPIKLESVTVAGTVNSITSTGSRTYGLQVNSSGQGAINVPWTDTTYGAASLTASGTIELAAQTEVNTGTDALRALTPATLAGATLDGGTF